jgi:hypothetical protein
MWFRLVQYSPCWQKMLNIKNKELGKSSDFCRPFFRRIIQSKAKTKIIVITVKKMVHHSPLVKGDMTKFPLVSSRPGWRICIIALENRFKKRIAFGGWPTFAIFVMDKLAMQRLFLKVAYISFRFHHSVNIPCNFTNIISTLCVLATDKVCNTII